MSVPSNIEHLYIHFPFCTGRCGYCAFLSGPPPRDVQAVLSALQQEALQRELPTLSHLQTLYCGGGTPGLIGCEGFKALRASNLFTFAQNYEWTIELHPATVTPILMETLAHCGVNRISIGVQSLQDDVLMHCNRRHTAQQALTAIEIARRFIPDTGIDLIAGLPGVSALTWHDTLQRVIDLDLPHLSIYALSIDEGSAWANAGVSPPDPELLCDAIAVAATKLSTAGYTRYETSNYAKPGFQCHHNLNTWHGGDYIGLGYGAASRIGLCRRDGFGKEIRLTAEEDALERCLTHLRLNEGFNLAEIRMRYPLLRPYTEAWEKRLQQFHKAGLLNAVYAPTTRGYEVLDAMERSLLEDTF